MRERSSTVKICGFYLHKIVFTNSFIGGLASSFNEAIVSEKGILYIDHDFSTLYKYIVLIILLLFNTIKIEFTYITAKKKPLSFSFTL